MSETVTQTAQTAADNFRARLGQNLILWSTAALIALGIAIVIAAIVSANQSGDAAVVIDTTQLLLSSLLPLFATWVGTVLAFYYTKENYQAAKQDTLDIVASINQRLSKRKVGDEMLRRSQIVSQLIRSGDFSKVKISETAQQFQQTTPAGKPITRLLLVDEQDKFLGIFHRATWDQMLVAGLTKVPPVVLETDTLDRLISLPFRADSSRKYADYIKESIAFVSIDKSLAEAKSRMEEKLDCQDIIVTQNGLATDPVLGWISNVDITRLSTVE